MHYLKVTKLIGLIIFKKIKRKLKSSQSIPG